MMTTFFIISGQARESILLYTISLTRTPAFVKDILVFFSLFTIFPAKSRLTTYMPPPTAEMLIKNLVFL